MANNQSPIPRYVISVAARLVGVAPHTLRLYEQKGLLQPARSHGRNRLYSDADIARLRRIAELARQGVNPAGIKLILEMEEGQSVVHSPQSLASGLSDQKNV